MRRRLRRRAGQHEPADINITAFMNLMVILVPFLLITAVFSRTSVDRTIPRRLFKSPTITPCPESVPPPGAGTAQARSAST